MENTTVKILKSVVDSRCCSCGIKISEGDKKFDLMVDTSVVLSHLTWCLECGYLVRKLFIEVDH